jgi:hypothetical protein
MVQADNNDGYHFAVLKAAAAAAAASSAKTSLTRAKRLNILNRFLV